MKLIYRILIRLFTALTIILSAWGIFFYIAMMEEINDETDDSLEDYSETLIIRALTGYPLPVHSDGTNNSYYLNEVSEEYAKATPHLRYSEEMIYIEEKKETEPARILKTIFKDKAGHHFELTVSTPTIEKEDLREAILQWIVILYFTLLVLILILNVYVYYGSMKPLYMLLEWLDQYTLGKNQSPPELKTDIREFQKLHEAALRSTERNQAIFEQQKQFIGNASHELQTPLAICQNRLEMLAEGEQLSEEQLLEIHKIQQTLSHIIRLNKSLLLLSKIENSQFQQLTELCLNDVIHRQITDFQEIYSYLNIDVQIEEQSQLNVKLNETLAIALITNLLKNAFVHNHPGGNIQIIITKQNLSFYNTGIGEALDTEKIFHRFYQGKNAGPHSTGLGLSITEAICKLYAVQLTYSFTGKHQFNLKFPD